jgi:hypothetical protein
MNRVFFVAVALALTMGTTNAFSNEVGEAMQSTGNSETMIAENQLTAENLNLIKERVEEIWNMDRSDLTVDSRHELRQELRKFKDLIQNQDPYIYIGGGTLILIIILLILLL